MSSDLSMRAMPDMVYALRPIKVAPSPRPIPAESTQERKELATGGEIFPQEAAAVIPGGVAQVASVFVQQAQSISRELEFRVDEELGRTIVTVYDAKTQEMIRQMPVEEALALARTLPAEGGLILEAEA